MELLSIDFPLSSQLAQSHIALFSPFIPIMGIVPETVAGYCLKTVLLSFQLLEFFVDHSTEGRLKDTISILHVFSQGLIDKRLIARSPRFIDLFSKPIEEIGIYSNSDSD